MFKNEQGTAGVTPSWFHEALEALRVQGFEVEPEPRTDLGAGPVLRLRRRSFTRSYLAHLTEKPQPSLIKQDETDLPLLLVSPHLSRQQDNACQQLGLNYVDASGNMLLDWGDIHVHLSGRRPEPEVHPRSGTAAGERPAFRPRGLQVVFTLLCAPDRLPSHRELAVTSGASLGTTNNAMHDLESQGYLTTLGTPRVHRRRELFERWTSAYLLNLYPRLDLGTYRIESDIATIIPIDPDSPTVLSGESAVALLYNQLRPTTLTLYSAERPQKLLAEWRARSTNDRSSANVFVRKKFWDFPGPEGLAPSPLIYADLLASDDARQIEAAALLRSRDELLRAIDQR